MEKQRGMHPKEGLTYNEIREKIKELIESFLNGSHKDRATILKDTLLKELVEPMSRDKNKPSKHQIRRYYHHFLEILEDSSEAVMVKTAMLKVYINYDARRKQIKSKHFRAFIEGIVDSALSEGDLNNTLKRLRNAQLLFEAFVGYTANF